MNGKAKGKKEKKRVCAVMTVEASLVLPVFLMLFMNLLSILEVYRIHSSVAASLWQEGRETAKNMYLKEAAEGFFDGSSGEGGDASTEAGGISVSAVLTSFSVQRQIIKDLEAFPIWEQLVVGKKAGFLVRSETGEDGTVRIDCNYRIHPLFTSLTPVAKGFENHYYGHAWIGYVHGGSETGEEEIFVYITENGTVYHRNRGCSYLNPSIKSAGKTELESLRNKSGAIYYVCPLCGGGAAGRYYVTDYGTNYHTSIACPGLKRTIYEVRLSEVDGRGPCSKCGG